MQVAGIDGPTWCASGRHVGRRCAVVRVGKGRHVNVEDVVAAVVDMGVDHLAVTGARPLADRDSLIALADVCGIYGIDMAVETPGRAEPGDRLLDVVAHWDVRPDMARPGSPALASYRDGARSVWFLFDVHGYGDLLDAGVIVRGAGLPARDVWLEVHSDAMAYEAVACGWNIARNFAADGDRRTTSGHA